ncbi:MAG: hypothetical protein AAGU19_15010 [Prolixibacteraceae bacterium]
MIIRNTTILLLFSAILVLHPVLPFIEYYTFREYIAENLCVNRENPQSCCEGKCYLEKRVEESTPDNNPEKQNPAADHLKRIEYNLPVKNNPCFCVAALQVEFGYLNPLYSAAFSKTIFQPPQGR